MNPLGYYYETISYQLKIRSKIVPQVYMATTKYASEYLMQYDGHNTPVNNVKFNPFVPVGLRDLKKIASEWILMKRHLRW